MKEEVVFEYMQRLAPEFIPAARAFLAKLPPGWYREVPRPCHRNDGSFSSPAVTHALLYILEPARFPPARRTKMLAEYMCLVRKQSPALL